MYNLSDEIECKMKYSFTPAETPIGKKVLFYSSVDFIQRIWKIFAGAIDREIINIIHSVSGDRTPVMVGHITLENEGPKESLFNQVSSLASCQNICIHFI